MCRLGLTREEEAEKEQDVECCLHCPLLAGSLLLQRAAGPWTGPPGASGDPCRARLEPGTLGRYFRTASPTHLDRSSIASIELLCGGLLGVNTYWGINCAVNRGLEAGLVPCIVGSAHHGDKEPRHVSTQRGNAPKC